MTAKCKKKENVFVKTNIITMLCAKPIAMAGQRCAWPDLWMHQSHRQQVHFNNAIDDNST